ncbi:SODIUM/HYDROGEN EXCHANGER 2 [Salix koriyanagi]|uniref:SODIUM/HYDROGEN EXCHANGER 2 n=1 Tax=Salix koriyanagi TaxID=2511006 RepID=A0A9Q0W1E2_9ROSI|nr:SODIUM/HYDROGEN EXCHANGER 2 [Salix koriyanagi]
MEAYMSSIGSKLQMLNTSDHASVVSMNLFVALLCGCIVIGHLLEETRWMNESITALTIGVCTGIVILLISGGKSSRLLVFSEDLFFIYLLPPIIFNAGFQVKKKQFFRNFMTIMLFGAVGTLICCAIITTGAVQIFKKMDIGPLDIGRLSSNWCHICCNGLCLHIAGAYTLLGVLTGLVSAYIIKKLYFGRHSTDREVALMILMAYLSYILAELFYLSGILTSSRITTKHAFATLSFVAEIFIFLYVGMDALDIEKWKFVSDSPGTSIAVSSILLGLVMVGRAAFVFPLSFLSNLSKKSPNEKISFRQQFIIWWAGLMRGAVSMALAYNKFTSAGHTNLRANAIMITSTITVVLFSTMVFGLMTKPLISLLLPHPKDQSRSLSFSSDPTTPKSFTLPLLGEGQDSLDDLGGHEIPRPSSLRALLTTPTHTVHYYWRKFDNAFMRPMFGGRGFVPFVPGSPTERNPPNQWH